MALNIKNPEVEQLAADIAATAGETKTEAIRRALLERKQRLAFRTDGKDKYLKLLEFLEHEVWCQIPKEMLGVPMSEAEHDQILGFGSEGI